MAAYPNGLIPRSTLTQISSGHRLRADAAAAFKRLDDAFLREFKKRISVTDAYRDLAQQVAVKALKGAFAAKPGTSNHGWGIALDLGSGINSATSREHRWMDAVAHEYGWVNPPWATDDNPRNGQFEPWHWEYVPHLDQHDGTGEHVAARPPTPTVQEDDMPTTEEIVAGIMNAGHPEFAGRTFGQFLAQIRAEVGSTRTHLQGVVEGTAATTVTKTVNGVMNAPVTRAGIGTGTATLSSVIAWTDDHTIRILQAINAAGMNRASVVEALNATLQDVKLTVVDTAEKE